MLFEVGEPIAAQVLSHITVPVTPELVVQVQELTELGLLERVDGWLFFNGQRVGYLTKGYFTVKSDYVF